MYTRIQKRCKFECIYIVYTFCFLIKKRHFDWKTKDIYIYTRMYM